MHQPVGLLVRVGELGPAVAREHRAGQRRPAQVVDPLQEGLGGRDVAVAEQVARVVGQRRAPELGEQHRAVADVACVGVPNEDLGEEIKAVVELRPGFTPDAALRQSLTDFCVEHLAKQKWPRSIDFVAELPRSEAGKVLRRALRERYWAGRERQI